MISPVKVCDLGAAKLPAARHKVIAKPPPIFFVDFCIRTLLSSTLESLFAAFHLVSAREPRFLTSLREKFAQDATASHEHHRDCAWAQFLLSSDAIATPNARWAARTVAAKCHPKSTPNKPTPNPCTTGLTRNPTPTATP